MVVSNELLFVDWNTSSYVTLAFSEGASNILVYGFSKESCERKQKGDNILTPNISHFQGIFGSFRCSYYTTFTKSRLRISFLHQQNQGSWP